MTKSLSAGEACSRQIFQAEACAKQEAYRARVVPHMNMVREYYTAVHGLGVADGTRSPRA